MNIKYNSYNQTEPSRIYLGNVNNEKICCLNGIQPESVSLKMQLNNTFILNFKLDRYISFFGKQIESNGYNLLDDKMRLYVDNFGWFIMQTPATENDGHSEIKVVSAESVDIELTQHDIVGFKVNCGTTDSYEMLAAGNVEIDFSGVEWAQEQIKFYNQGNPDLSLLHLVLKASGLRGWSIGYVDKTPKKYTSYVDGKTVEKHVMLQDEIGRFDIDSKSAYGFYTQDIEQYFECIILFDINNFTINAYRVESLGKDTNVTIGLRNLQNTNSITVDEDSIFTRFRVQGGDNLSIHYVNIGNPIIENINHKLTTKYIPQELIDKYKLWQNDHDIARVEYTGLTRKYNSQLSVISELYDRVPLDDCSTDWIGFSLPDLENKKSDYEAYKLGLEALFKDNNGNLDHTALQASDIADEYNQIVNTIIPNIKVAIHNKGVNTEADKQVYTKVTDWSLYGVDELKNVILHGYEGEKEVLESNGYSEPYAEKSGHSKDHHDQCYAQYIDVSNQLNENFVGSAAEAYKARCQEATEAENLANQYLTERSAIAKSVDKENWSTVVEGKTTAFTENDLRLLSSLYNDTDYVNDNMFLVSTDDQVTAIDEQQKLYDAAVEELHVVSQPQYKYTTTLDNLFAQYKFKDYTHNIELGDYLRLGVRDDYQVKLRVISIKFNPMVYDNEIEIEFSNMIRSKSKRNDFASLLDLANYDGKNQISGTSNNSTSNLDSGSLAYILNKIVTSSALSNKIDNSINQSFGGYIGTLMVLKELEAEMIKCVDIKAENGFFQYLQSQLISTGKIIADSGQFKNLEALVARIDLLLAGTVSAELGHVIKLTAQNVSIDEAVIKQLIAAQIMVSDLKSGKIYTDEMNIVSHDGGFSIIGNTMQFTDKSGKARIQIGRDAKDNFTFLLYDNTGNGVLIDSEGIKPSAISDGLIQTKMVADGAITEAKIDKTNIQEWTDSQGNRVFDVSKLYYGNDKFSISYNQLKTDVNDTKTTVTNVSSKVDAVEKAIINTINKSDLIKTVDSNGTAVENTLIDTVVKARQDVKGLTNTVSETKSQLINKADGSVVSSLSEKVSLMEQDANGFKQTVSDTYATKDTLNSITIGGRNYLIGSSSYTKDSPYKLTGTGSDTYKHLNDLYCDLEAGVQYTVTAKTDGVWSNHAIGAGGNKCSLWLVNGTNNLNFCLTKDGTTSWSFTPPKTLRYIIRLNVYASGDVVNFWNLKVEKGKYATDWSPAPEDINNKLADYSTTTQMTSAIEQKANSITQTVKDLDGNVTKLSTEIGNVSSRVTDNKNNIAQVKQTATKLESTLSHKKDAPLTEVKYIRDWLNGNTVDTSNKWVECYVSVDGKNVASNLTPVGKDANLNSASITNAKFYTDGLILDSESSTENYATIGSTGWCCLELDLGEIYRNIDFITIWHNYDKYQAYNHKLQVSTDGTSWITLYDSDQSGKYTETSKGMTYYFNDGYSYDAISSLKQEVDNVQITLSDTKNSVGTFQVKADQITSAIEDVNGVLSNNSATLVELSKTLNTLSGDVNAHKTEIIQTIKSIINRVASVEGHTANLSEVVQDADGWKALFAKLNMYNMPNIQTNITLDINGITVVNPKNGQKTLITIDEFAGYFNNEKVFYLNQDLLVTKRVFVEKGIDTNAIKLVPITYKVNGTEVKGLAHVKSGGAS